jgi:sensor c-di-GMP phosphodiesterase-like protein
MSLYQIVDQFEPLRLMIQVEATTDANLRDYLERETIVQRELAERGQRYIAICDATIGMRLTPVQRKLYADWMKRNDAVLSSVLAGAAFVMPSALVRGALTAIFWVAPLKSPHSVHARLDQAIEWAIDRAKHAELPLHERLAREGAAALSAYHAASA